MLKRTHEAFSGVFWSGGTLCLNLTALKLGYEIPVQFGAVLAGFLLAIPFSAGKNSPDFDQLIWPGPPKRDYYWKGHRGITHRFWFATLIISLPFLIAWWISRDLIPSYWTPIFFALPVGWWSHLFGDMIYGRILIAGHPYGLGWTTGGLTETGKRKYGGKRYVIDPAAKTCTVIAGCLITIHLWIWVQGGLF